MGSGGRPLPSTAGGTQWTHDRTRWRLMAQTLQSRQRVLCVGGSVAWVASSTVRRQLKQLAPDLA